VSAGPSDPVVEPLDHSSGAQSNIRLGTRIDGVGRHGGASTLPGSSSTALKCSAYLQREARVLARVAPRVDYDPGVHVYENPFDEARLLRAIVAAVRMSIGVARAACRRRRQSDGRMAQRALEDISHEFNDGRVAARR
jgi:hypothetical protein